MQLLITVGLKLSQLLGKAVSFLQAFPVLLGQLFANPDVFCRFAIDDFDTEWKKSILKLKSGIKGEAKFHWTNIGQWIAYLRLARLLACHLHVYRK